MREKQWTANEIFEARKAAGLTQGEMAESLGCRLQTISEWECGLYKPKNAYKRLLSLFFAKSKK